MTVTKTPNREVLGWSRTDLTVIGAGFPLAAVAVGAALPFVASWLVETVRVLPFGFVFRLFDAIDAPGEIALHLGGWLILGIVLVVVALRSDARVELTAADLTLSGESRSVTLARAEISAVFPEGKTLVVLDRRSREIARERPRASADRLREAFRRHGYPWSDDDPYATLYKPWILGSDDLPSAANALLALRQTAVRRKARSEARDLRRAVQELGFVLRDDGGTQSWRPLVGS